MHINGKLVHNERTMQDVWDYCHEQQADILLDCKNPENMSHYDQGMMKAFQYVQNFINKKRSDF